MSRTDLRGARRRTPWWRTALSWILLLVFCVSAPLAILAGWARYNLMDEARYVATMQPLASDPRVQSAIEAATEQALGLAPASNPAADEPAGDSSGLVVRVLGYLGLQDAAAATPEPAVKRATTAAQPAATQASPPPNPTAAPTQPAPTAAPTAAPTQAAPTSAPVQAAPTTAPAPAAPTATLAVKPAAAPTSAPAAATPGLLDQISSGLDLEGEERTLVADVVDKVVKSPEFGKAWELANRKAYAGLTAVESGSGPVYLDLSAAASRVQQELQDRGIPGVDQIVIPPDSLSIEVLDGNTAASVRTVLKRLDVYGIALPIVAILSLIGSIWAAGNRLVALRRVGFGLAISTIVMLLVLLIGQQSAVSHLSDRGMADAAQAVIDTLIRTPVLWSMIAVVAGLALALLTGTIGWLRGR